jgi:hypothetical protein
MPRCRQLIDARGKFSKWPSNLGISDLVINPRIGVVLSLFEAPNEAPAPAIHVKGHVAGGDQLSVAARSFRIPHCEPIQKPRLSTIGLTSLEILADLSEIIGEFFFLDNEKLIFICLD